MRNDLGYFQHRPTERFYRARGLHHAPKYVKARVLKASSMAALTGNANEQGLSRAVQSGHIGMVQPLTAPAHTRSRSARPKVAKQGRRKVGKLVTMGSPSASAMHPPHRMADGGAGGVRSICKTA